MQLLVFCSVLDDIFDWRMVQKLFSHLLSHSLQWQNGRSWVSYESMHFPSLETAYEQFVSDPGASSAFIEISGDMGTFDYQFDFAASAAAPQSERDAPQGFPVCAVVGTQMNLQSGRRRAIRRCTCVPQTTQPDVHDESDALRHAQCLFDVLEMLSTELVICSNSVENAELSVDFLDVFRSELTSTMILQMIQSEKSAKLRQSVQLASHLPQLLNLSSRLMLFRHLSGTNTPFQQKIYDRVEGVDRVPTSWLGPRLSPQPSEASANPFKFRCADFPVRISLYFTTHYLQLTGCSLSVTALWRKA